MKQLLSALMLILFLFIITSHISAEVYRLSAKYRPVTIAIFWAGWEDEREHTQFEYNKKGRLIKTLVYRGRETPSWHTAFEYDKENNLIRKSVYSDSELSRYTLYTYYHDRLYEEAERDKKGNYTQIKQYEYDDKGNIFSIALRRTPYNGTTPAWETMELLFYSNNQQVDKKLEYYNGTLNSKSTYTYSPESLEVRTVYLGDLRDMSSQGIKTFSYNKKGKLKDKLNKITYTYLNYADGKEYVECCTTYSMVPEYDKAGNMTTLSYYNCENEPAGKAVITWEKGKTDMAMIIEVFDELHWYFTGC